MSQEKENPKLSQSELELGRKWDRCLQDLLIKFGSGVGLGIVFSVVLFRSKKLLRFNLFLDLWQYCVYTKNVCFKANHKAKLFLLIL